MKMIQSNYAKLEAGISAVLSANPGAKQSYLDRGLSLKRFAWDCLHAAKIDGRSGIEFVCGELYNYLNDTHIDTALLRIVS
jgi:hypothetical protein